MSDTISQVGDLHELLITEDDHAVVIVYTPKQIDLTEFGGASDGWILENIFQEIDLDTNVRIGCGGSVCGLTLCIGGDLFLERQ